MSAPRADAAGAGLFGTDGVRGVPGEPPLDRSTLAALGAAVAGACCGPGHRVLIGRDTRESGEWMTEALAAGVAGAASRPVDAGVLPTPAVAFLTRAGGYDAGLVVSASHNPHPDNGVKVFTADGEKADADLEARIAASVSASAPALASAPAPASGPASAPASAPALASAPVPASASDAAPVSDASSASDAASASAPAPALASDAIPASAPAPRIERVSTIDEYVEHTAGILASVPVPAGLRIAVDCANGATSRTAPAVLRRLGLDPVVLHDRPDGRNINRGCGSTQPGLLARAVVEQGCDLGAAFDGDGDRVVLVDHRGGLVSGDAVLLVVARWLAARGRLARRAVVATVMSNVALEEVLAADGIALHRCAVGDRVVRAEMRRRGLVLGGEQSGHVILADHLPTGDGLAVTLAVLRAMIETGRGLAELTADLTPRPQVLVNVAVRRRAPLEELPGVPRLIDAAERQLAGVGRVLVRYSGTEPLLRIMIEGPDEAQIRSLAEEIADCVRAEIGVEPGARR